jgi:EAL domain-containing protein (putative c-di-GMP-specific phosphodiesterase class I)
MAHVLEREPKPDEVTIDASFMREQAQDAFRQFFRPIVASFQAMDSGRVSYATSQERIRKQKQLRQQRGRRKTNKS